MRSLPKSLALAAALVASLHAAAPVALTEEKILADVSRELAAHYSLEGDLQLELLRQIPLPQTTASSWQVHIADYPNAAAPNLLLRCQFVADDQIVADTTLMLHASLWRDAWSARQTLTVGAPFDPAQLAVQRVDFLRDREALPATAGDSGYIFSRAVAASRLLTWRDIARRPLVRKGDLIEVVASDGVLSVTLQAQALENGAAGEAVSVRNLDSKKTFSAIVTDEKRAQIRL